MKCSSALRGAMGAISVLVPLWAGAESHLEAAGGKVSVAAHADFRIVIPQVLSLGVAHDPVGFGAQQVAIFSNSRNVTLAATSGPTAAARDSVILRAAAGSVIAREAACRFPLDPTNGVAPKIAPKTSRLICTVSMP
ncbi:MAG TPA: hypothetical protein VKP66_21710 [Steroidobacteraceae bacterium]|nr:hypothetical protein [Steroidobacteraceae bacterium]